MNVGSVYLTLKDNVVFPWAVPVTQEQWDWLKNNVKQEEAVKI